MPKVGRERKSINPNLQTQISNTRKGTKTGTTKGTKKGTQKNKNAKKYWLNLMSEISTGSKSISKLVSTEELGDWAKDYGFPFPNNPEEYIVFQFKDDEKNEFDSNAVYNELSLHHKLSLKGFMPKIVWCIDNGPDHKNSAINPLVYSFPEFIESLDPKNPIMPKDMRYIVEKVTCGTDSLSTYKENYAQYFSDIKGLFHRLAVEEGIMLLDMKPEHICKNKTGELCFIDADVYFVENINETDIDNAVTYTLFQVYAMLNAYNFKIDIKDTGITESEYENMMKYIVDLQITRDCSKEYVAKHTPLEMLIRYSKRASDSSTDIMTEIKAFYAPSVFHNFCKNYVPVLLPIFYHINDQFKRRGIIIGDFQ
jgi:hypothetical protein